MTSPIDGDPLQQSESNPTSIPALHVTKTRSPTRNESSETSTPTLAFRTSTPPNLSSRSSTLVNDLSRSSSPNGRLPLSLSFARFGRSANSSPLNNAAESYDDLRNLVVRAFSPTVAVYVAQDADDIAKRKGLKGGLVSLIRPYGERIQGKVVVRDSVGASRAWDDFGVHFTDLGRLAQDGASESEENPSDTLEELMEQYLEQMADQDSQPEQRGEMSPYYRLFMARLLQAHKISPHEAFRHPVGTVIAISSATPQPIETLRQLYQQTAQGSRALPSFANPEYLRYYVLVHDEDRDDLAKSSALFDQMKRHFGLHCHLLRLRSVQCTQSDDDSEEIPPCEWLSPSEDLSHLQETTNLMEPSGTALPYIFNSDASAIRTFVRELVAQSIVPHMEQRIALWNEQVASRRRGISGRFMSLSKRWAGIGSSARNASSATNLTASGISGNYDSLQGFYRYDTAEAILRKLADFSFMLRDYKLASSTYDLIRSDYANDKAWKYLAGANEMCYVSNLLNPLVGQSSSKFKVDNFDQMIETASYSYLTRCSDPTLALRALLLGVELLKVRGKTASEIASKWAIRAVELGLVGSVGHVLLDERIADCFSNQIGVGSTTWGQRKRKAALWNVMAADEWMKLGRAEFAANRLDEARELYSDLKHGDSLKNYGDLDQFMQQLHLAVKMKLGQARHRGLSNASQHQSQPPNDLLESEDDESGDVVEQMTDVEKLDGITKNRHSVVGIPNPLEMITPLSPARVRSDTLGDDFE